MTDFDKIVDDDVTIDAVLKQEQKEKDAFRILLNKEHDKKNHLFVQAVKMGVTKSYLTSASLEWVAEKVMYASQLPIFKEYIDQIRLRSIKRPWQ